MNAQDYFNYSDCYIVRITITFCLIFYVSKPVSKLSEEHMSHTDIIAEGRRGRDNGEQG